MYKSILDTIKNYVLIDYLGQAIVIDGELGGGKTYFIYLYMVNLNYLILIQQFLHS